MNVSCYSAKPERKMPSLEPPGRSWAAASAALLGSWDGPLGKSGLGSPEDMSPGKALGENPLDRSSGQQPSVTRHNKILPEQGPRGARSPMARPPQPPGRLPACDKGRKQPKTNKQLELMGQQLFLA